MASGIVVTLFRSSDDQTIAKVHLRFTQNLAMPTEPGAVCKVATEAVDALVDV
jgi:hypothetical protein